MHIAKVPFTFLMAPQYHPALAAVAPYRKALPYVLYLPHSHTASLNTPSAATGRSSTSSGR